MIALLIGYRKFTSKKGTNCCIVSLVVDYSDFDVQHGACGQKVDEVFIPENCHGLIQPNSVGRYYELEYGAGIGGRPAVTGIHLVPEEKKKC